MNDKIKKLKEKIDILEKKLADPETIRQKNLLKSLSQEYRSLKASLKREEEIEKINRLIQETTSLLEDEELAPIAKQELEKLRKDKKKLEEQVKNELSERNGGKIVMEIRAGTGGEEAALFAADLLKMYIRFCEKKGWETKILNESRTSLGGFKEVIFEIKGRDAWPLLCKEAGVHRVQRIPKTEKSGRIHTSTVSVAVLDIPKNPEIKIDPKDLKIETFKSSGHGGQNVQKLETAVRITHLPTNIVITCQNERSQWQNKLTALNILKAKLKNEQLNQLEERTGSLRRSQIGQARRAEKIRTYNFPQNRVTDHRIGKTWHNLEEILEGNISDILQALKNYEN